MKINSKVIITVFAIIFSAVLIYALWRFFAVPKSSLKPPEINDSLSQDLNISRPRLQKISDQPVFDFWITPNTGNIYYFSLDGKIFNAKNDQDTILSNQTINALNNTILSPDKQKILASFGDPRQPQWGIFDLIDKIWRPLPSEILNATWGLDDQEIIAFVKNGIEQNLVRFNLAKNPLNYQTIIKNLNLEDVKIEFQKPRYLIISEKPTAFYAGNVWILDLENLSFNSLFDKENGLILKKSIDGDIFFKFSTFGEFAILDSQFQTLRPPSFKTIPQKCEGFFEESELIYYCFVPKELPNKIVLPDDYFQRKFYSIDDFYIINALSGEILASIQNNQEALPNFDIVNLQIIPPIDAINPQYFDGLIYFINRYDGYLYELTF